MTRLLWRKESGYIYRINNAQIFFLSGGPTANLLLSCDEAQDVQMAKWNKDFAPMAAVTSRGGCVAAALATRLSAP